MTEVVMARYALLLLAIGCGTGESAVPAAAQGEEIGGRVDVDVAGLAAARAAGAPVLDVRTLEEFDAGHVPGALHIPLQELDPEDARLAAHRGAPLYVICESGRRSAKAADQLAAAGFQVVNVQGGTAAWKAAGHPVE